MMRMKTNSFLNRVLLTLSLLAGLVPGAFAVNITFVGAVVATNAANIAEVQGWRSTSVGKTYDALGVRYYGSAGYIMYAMDATPNANGGAVPTADPLTYTNAGTTMATYKQLPGWVTLANNGQNQLAVSYGYPVLDSPIATVGATVTDMELGFAMRNGIAYSTEATIVNITLTAGFPANGARLGIMAGGGGDAPGTIRLTQTTGSGGGTASVPSVDRGASISIYFFDLKQVNVGDVITLYLSKPSAGSGNQNLCYSGLTFDLLPSTVISYETFAGYRPGALIGQTNLSAGFASGTNWFGTNNAYVAPQVNLDWTNGSYSLNPAGGRIETLPDGNGPALFALMDTNLNGAFGKYGLVTNGIIGASNISGNLYFSFLARDKDGNGSSAADFFGFELFNGTTEVIGIGNSFGASAYSLLWGANSLDLTNGAGGYLNEDNNVHFFVGKIAYQAGANDILSVWMDPDINPLTGETGQGSAVYRRYWTNDATFDRIVLRSGSTDNRKGVEFDEIRFGQSWADVTAVPLIAVQPQSQVGSVGGSVTLSVGASGVRPLTYQWFFNGAPISGATSATLTLTSLSSGNAGDYGVVVANAAGAVVSSNATLVVTNNPVLLGASTRGNPNGVYLFFSHNVSTASALNAANYGVVGFSYVNGVTATNVFTITNVTWGPAILCTNGANSVVALGVSPAFGEGTNYMVGVTNVQDGSSLSTVPNPATATFVHGQGLPGNFFSDFNNGVPPGSDVKDVAYVDSVGGETNGGALKLTRNFGSINSAWVTDDLLPGQAVTSFRATFNAAIGGNGNPADGFGFSFSPSQTGYNGLGENGVATGLVISFVTYSGAVPKVTVRWNNAPLVNGTNLFQPSQLAGMNYLPVVINLRTNGAVDVWYNGTNLFNNFPTPYTPQSGWRFSLSARTGGAMENHWFDDVAIRVGNTTNTGSILAPMAFVTEPTNSVIVHTFPVTFSAWVDGSPNWRLQWWRNGSPIANATNQTYSISAVTYPADDGAQFTFTASNDFSYVTKTVTLTVTNQPLLLGATSRGNPNGIYAFFSKNMDPTTTLNAGNYYVNNGISVTGAVFVPFLASNGLQSAVLLQVTPALTTETAYTVYMTNLLATNGATIYPNPASWTFFHGQDVPMVFNSSFSSSGIWSNETLFGNATLNSGVIKLTTAAGSLKGGFLINDFSGGRFVSGFKATFKLYIGGGTAAPADGFGFHFSTNTPAVLSAGTPQEAVARGLSICFDTYNNGAGDGNTVAVDVWTNGVLVSRLAMQASQGSGATTPNYLPVTIQLTTNGLLTVTYNGTNLFSNLQTYFPGLSGGQFYMAAATGGAYDNHWLDDLRISTLPLDTMTNLGPVSFVITPTNTTVPERLTATFAAGMSGTPPYYYQWLSNGVALAGATNFFYSVTPPVMAGFDGTRYSVTVSNEFSSITSADAVLTVQPAPLLVGATSRGYPNSIFVWFNRDMDPTTTLVPANYAVNNGLTVTNVVFAPAFATNGSQSAVRLDVTPTLIEATYYTVTVSNVQGTALVPIFPNPTSTVFQHGADVVDGLYYGMLVSRFGSGTPAGTALYGNAAISGGVLHLTDAVGSQAGALVISDINGGRLVNHFTAAFKLRIGGGTATPADGFGFHFSPTLPNGTFNATEAWSNGLSICFDTYNNGAGDNNGAAVDVWWNSNLVSRVMMQASQGSAGTNFFDVVIKMETNGNLTVSYNGTNIFTSLATSFTNMVGGKFYLGANTGGSTDNHWVDDLRIYTSDTSPLSALAFVTQPTNTTVIENLGVTFTASVRGTPPYFVQWSSNGLPLAGATNFTYTVSNVTVAAFNGVQYSVNVSNEFSSITSTNALLTVVPAPLLLGAASRGNPSGIYVWFNRDMDPTTTLNTNNYTVSQGVLVTNVSFFRPWLPMAHRAWCAWT